MSYFWSRSWARGANFTRTGPFISPGGMHHQQQLSQMEGPVATNTTPNVGDNVVIDEETVPDGWARYGEIAETDGQSYVIALEDGNTCEILPDQFRVVGDGEEPPATGFANGDRIILSGRHVDDEDTAHTGTVDGIRPDGRLVLRMNDHRTVMVWPADAVKDATTARNPA